jgi:hypothetical protein
LAGNDAEETWKGRWDSRRLTSIWLILPSAKETEVLSTARQKSTVTQGDPHRRD